MAARDTRIIELIAIDPAARAPSYLRWFGLDHFTGPPRLISWVCRDNPLAYHPAAGSWRRHAVICTGGSQSPTAGCQPVMVWPLFS
ncbi:MAG: VOC family protein [Paracoccus sp. (in: a-proteobacteria)]